MQLNQRDSFSNLGRNSLYRGQSSGYKCQGELRCAFSAHSVHT